MLGDDDPTQSSHCDNAWYIAVDLPEAAKKKRAKKLKTGARREIVLKTAPLSERCSTAAQRILGSRGAADVPCQVGMSPRVPNARADYLGSSGLDQLLESGLVVSDLLPSSPAVRSDRRFRLKYAWRAGSATDARSFPLSSAPAAGTAEPSEPCRGRQRGLRLSW